MWMVQIREQLEIWARPVWDVLKRGQLLAVGFPGPPHQNLSKMHIWADLHSNFFICKKLGLETRFGLPTDQYESKGRKFSLKITKKHVQNQRLVMIPVIANFGVPKTTHARFSHPPYPNSGKKSGFGKLALKTFFVSFGTLVLHKYNLNDQKA